MSLAATYLNVPFAEKNEAKALGAKWDPTERAWYVPEGRDAAPFARWMGEGPADPRPDPEPVALETREPADALSLAAYMANAQALVRRHLSAKVWVAAEIAEGGVRGNHLYLTLAETDGSGTVTAQARAVAFSATMRPWFREFVRTVGQAPAAGMKVLVPRQRRAHLPLRLPAADPFDRPELHARRVRAEDGADPPSARS